MQAPTVSIIIPVYNAEAYIVECLDSIYDQSIAPNQVIIVDDGSTDRSGTLIDSFRSRPNTLIIRTENGGPGPARNAGLEHVTSEYVYFFDADDVMSSDFMQKALSYIEKSDSADAILFAAQSVADTAYGGSYRDAIHRMGFHGLLTDEGSSIIRQLLTKNILNAAVHSYITKTELWLNLGLRFPNHYYEDEALLYPFYANIHKVFVVDEVVYTRRIRPSSIMTSKKNVHHALGALTVSTFTLAYYQRHREILIADRPLWERRISNYAIYYMRICREIGMKVNYRELFRIIAAIRSPRLFLRVVMN